MKVSEGHFINFFCVGAQKAGTTTLHDILKQHPDIYLPEKKEAHYFDLEERYIKGIQWYINNFYMNYSGEKICGEITPEYLYFEKVPERLFREFGSNLKLVFIFRNPIDRAFSHYLMNKRRLIEDNTFEKATKLEIERISQGEFENFNYSYLSRGFYALQLKRYLKYFPLNNMHFINFEQDLVKNRESTISRLLRFLELPETNLNIEIISNKAKSPRFKSLQYILYKRSIFKNLFRNLSKDKKERIKEILERIIFFRDNDEKVDFKTREHLKSLFLEDIEELETLTGKDYSNWK
jgi:hypothetical protein